MAHHKRKRCRLHSSPHISTTTYRKRHGLPMLRRQHWSDVRGDAPVGSKEYYWLFHNWVEEGRREWPAQYNMMSNNPRWWDILFHTRPTRRKAAEVTKAVLLGKIDPDAAVWPLSRKPRIYYW
jgi:hypothetical protein